MDTVKRSGGVLLRIISDKCKKAKEPIDIQDLLNDIERAEGSGLFLYTYDKSPSGFPTSVGFWYNIQALASTDHINVIGDNPHVEITEKGTKILDELEFPEHLESIIATV